MLAGVWALMQPCDSSDDRCREILSHLDGLPEGHAIEVHLVGAFGDVPTMPEGIERSKAHQF